MKVYPKHPNLLAEGTLRGEKVANPEGVDLGKIEDFMVDTDAGKVVYAILSFGGTLGMGNRLFAVPWNAMDLDTDKHAFILNVDKDKLKNAPGFDKDTWSDFSSLDWDNKVNEFYGQKPYWIDEKPAEERLAEAGRQSEAVVEASPPGTPSESTPESSPSGPTVGVAPSVRPIVSTSIIQARGLVRSSALKGEAVRNRAGEDLGKIEEIMIKLSDGSIGYAVLSFGGLLGLGSKLFAVPWHVMDFDSSKHEYVLDVSKSELKNAPGFDKSNWPDTENPDWDKEVRGFYGRTHPQRT